MYSTLPSSLKIGVIRGGHDPEYDLSLKTGHNVLNALRETHNPFDIFISKNGTWHINGIERSPERILKNIDVAFNALHGNFGEDGLVQEILDTHGVRYTGSGRYPSALSISKHITKNHITPFNIKTPVHALVKSGENVISKAKEIWNSMIHPFAVKPSKGGSAFGFAVVHNFDDFFSAVDYLLQSHDSVIVEEFIPGTSVSCLVTENFRGKDIYSFPTSRPINREDADVVEDYAKQVHKILGLSHYSQSDFIVSPKRGVYFLEVNSLPKLNNNSLAVKAVESVGVNTKDFVHHLLRLSLND